MSDLKLGRNGKQGSVNTETIKAGIKKEQIKDQKLQTIFDSIDGSIDGKKDGIIDAEEMKAFKKKLMETAGNDTLSTREAGKFLKKAGIKNLDKKDLFEFLDILSQSSENIEQSTVEEKNGQKFIHIKYKDGSVETINPDKSAQIATFSNGGGGKLTKYDKDRKITEEIIETEDGKKAVTSFDKNEKATQTVITAKGDSLVRTITYNENEEPETLKVENGTTTENYTYVEDGVLLTSKIENEGIPAKEKRTDYTYNEDGTTTAVTKEYGKETTRITNGENLVSETVTENTPNGGTKRTENIVTENGREVTVTEGENVTKTLYNSENKALSQTKTVNGQEYNVEYDGNGNTKVILQNGESIEALAKKFGCTKQELLDANGGKIRGWAGDDVVVPGELEADDKRLQGRQTKEEAIEAYKVVAAEIQAVKDEVAARKPISFTNKDYDTYEQLARSLFKREGIENPSKRQMKARIEDLQKTNPDLKDGELKGKRITANVDQGMHDRISDKEQTAKEYNKNLQIRQEAKQIADDFYKIADDNAGMASMRKMQKLLDTKVNEDNILAVLDAYDKQQEGDSSIIDTVTSEVGAGGTAAQKKVLLTIMDKLCAAAEKAGVSADDIKHARTEFETSMNKEMNAALRRTNPKDMEKAVDFLRGAIVAKQTGNVQEMSDADAIAVFNEDFKANDTEAQNAYKDAREEEGWTAKVGDTVCGWFGCTTIDDMDEKLGKNAADVKRLAEAAGNEAEFKKIYKEVFGVEFDKNKIAARDAALANYQQANNLSSSINITSDILKKSNSLDYSGLRNEIKNKFQYDDATLDSVIDNYADLLDKNISSDTDRKEMLVRFLEETQNRSTAEYRELTKGKTLEQMGKDLDLLTKSAFGTNDIVKDVIQFNENQQTTEMVTDAAFEIAGTIALQFVPGLGQVAAARLAVSAAKWGTKAVKVVNYAAKAEKAFAATKKFQTMNKATQIGTQMANAGVATAAVEASTGKDAKTVMKKTLMNMSFAGVGAGSSMLAPKLMQSFGITNKALANEIAEEIMNAAGSYGITKVAGDNYGSQDAFIDFATGIVMSRISHIKTPSGKGSAHVDTPDTPAASETGSRSGKPTADPPKTPKAVPQTDAPVLDVASSNGNATPSSVKVGDKKAGQIREEVNKAVSNPEISGEDLAQIRQEAGGIQNRDLRREVQQKIDDAVENLPADKRAAFDAANSANAQKNVDHIFEKHSELNNADTRVMNEYINNTDDAAVLEDLKAKLNEKEHTYGGVTANYDRLRKAIDNKLASLEPVPVKTNTQQHDEVVAMLNEKAATGKGLSETDFTQVKDYIASITDDAQLNELKGLLGGKKMTSAQKKQLKEAITSKGEELKNTPVQQPAQKEPEPLVDIVSDDGVDVTPQSLDGNKQIIKTPKGEMPLVTTVEDAQKMYDDMIKKDLLLTEDDIESKKGHIKFQRRGGWNFALPEVEQGTKWKIHLYANSPQEWANVAQVAMPYLQAENKAKSLWFKTVTGFDHLEHLRKTKYGDAQTGKAFTVYFKDEEAFLKAAQDLENLFDNSGLKSSGNVKNEAQIGKSGFVSYRNELEQRVSSNYKPEGMEDPYLKMKQEQGQEPVSIDHVDDDGIVTPEQVKQDNSREIVKAEEPQVRYPSAQERMEMGQIGNNISRAKTLEDLDKAQKWLDKMPDCDQKSRLISQLNEKRGKISAADNGVRVEKNNDTPAQVQESQNAGKPQNQAEIRRQHIEAEKAKIKELNSNFEAVNSTAVINGKQTPVKIYKNSQQGSNYGYWMQNLDTGELSYVKFPPKGRLDMKETTLTFTYRNGYKDSVTIDRNEIADIETNLYGKSAQAKSEALAADLYKAAGINAPEVNLIKDADGNIGTSSKFLDNLETPNADDIANIRKGFAADCWLANWDALKDGNIMTQNGNAIRTDVGGSLCYRARGARKGAAFGENVNELTSFFSQKSLSRKYLEGMSRDELISSLNTVTTIDDKTIISLVEKAKANGISNPEFLKEMLIERRNYMKRFQNLCETNPQKPGESIADYVKRMQNATPKTTYNIGGRSFDEIPISSRIYGNLDNKCSKELEYINKHISMAEHLTPSQKRIFEASYLAFENDSKGIRISHNANNVLTSDNLLHATNSNYLEDILANGLVSREYSGKVGASRSDGDPGSMTPMCTDVWDIQKDYSIKDYFHREKWNAGEKNFLPSPNRGQGTVVIVFDKKAVNPTLIDNSFSVSKQDSELYKDGNMSGHRNYITHRAVPVGLPSTAIDRIIVTTDCSKSYIDNISKQIKNSGLDIKIFDTNGNELFNPSKRWNLF